MPLLLRLRFLHFFILVVIVSGEFSTQSYGTTENISENEISSFEEEPQTTELPLETMQTTLPGDLKLPENSNDMKPDSITLPSIDSKDFLSEIAKTQSSKFPDVVPMMQETTINRGKSFRSPDDVNPDDTFEQCETLSWKDQEGADTSSELPFKLESVLTSSKTSHDEGWDVGDLTVVGSTESSLTVAWSPPNGTSEIKSYIVEWFIGQKNIGKCKCYNETFNFTIHHLESCTNYRVRVTPYSNNGLEKQRVVSDTTGLIVEKDSLNLKVSENSTEWLKLSWNLPSNDCVSKYTVTYCNSSACESADSSTTTYNATDLHPCTAYNFSVTVYGKSGEFGSTFIDTETNFLVPQAPTPAWTLAERNALTVIWTHPKGAECVQNYQVTLFSNGIQRERKKTEENQILMNGLGSCVSYEVVITPMHARGKSQAAIIKKSNTTLPAVLQAPEMDRPIPSSSKDQVTINWFVTTNRDNNCESCVINVTCNFSKVIGHGYNGTNGVESVNITSGTSPGIVETIITNLSPYTEYICQSVAINSQGSSEISAPVRVTTDQDIPWPPESLKSNFNNTYFELSWQEPKYVPGNLISYEINIVGRYNFPRPKWCKESDSFFDTIRNIKGTVFSYLYMSAVPSSEYSVKIKAETKAGWGKESENITFITHPGAPGPVSHLKFFITVNPTDPNILDSNLSWGFPCFMHGLAMDHFNITAIGERKNFETHEFTDHVKADHFCKSEMCFKLLKGPWQLREEYSYHFYVAGRVEGYYGLGETNVVTGVYPAGIPPEPDANYTAQITIDPYKAKRTTMTAAILLPLFPDSYGQIRCYAIIVSRKGYNNASFARNDLISGEWPDSATWHESKLADFKIPYQASKFCNNTYSSYVADYGKLKAVKFVLGEDTETCPELSSNREERSFCNGPLKPDTWYDIRIRAFTNGGYRDSMIFTVKTNAELGVAFIIVSIFGILFLGILLTMMVLVRKCSIQAVFRRFLHADVRGSPVPTPFNRRKFIAHCQQLADNPGKLSNEFQLLQTVSLDLQMPTNAACLQANRKKNRYTDILPYDFSRVKLEVIDDDPNSDYINASFINGYSGTEEYIACQGPKEDTTYDFWRMIDQYNVKLIVMLTQLIEKNKEKCHQYFPTARETFTYENMSIRCSQELDYRTYTHRILILQKENEKRSISHLHFKDWPDHDVPEDFDLVLNFCQIMRRSIDASRPDPAVIHCSAGIGRTGTLIAIDILLQLIKDNKKLEVFGTVYRMRKYRLNMVQRETQYAYIYNCIRQVLKNPYFSKTYKPPSVDGIAKNSSNKKDSSITNLVNSLETRM